jgi:hypothetical protein
MLLLRAHQRLLRSQLLLLHRLLGAFWALFLMDQGSWPELWSPELSWRLVSGSEARRASVARESLAIDTVFDTFLLRYCTALIRLLIHFERI